MRFASLLLGAMGLVACSGAGDADDGVSQDMLTNAPACLPVLTCKAPALDFKTRGWRHGFTSSIVSRLPGSHHRGRDMFVNPDSPQLVLGKFTYGPSDKDLHDEEVDVFVQRDCASGWEKVGTAVTTEDGEHPTVEGVEDNGGRIYFEIPAAKRLGPGQHRVRLVVAGDGSYTDMIIDVVPRGTKFFISDVDGTLTESENAEYSHLPVSEQPDTHPGAAQALQALAAKGYRPMYLTARPELLGERTRAFLEERGFPAGVIHTSAKTTGAGVGSGAASFKSAEIALLAKKGLVPTYGFGNKPSDSEAYASIPDPQHRIFFQIEGEFSGRRIESYQELVPGFRALDPVCQ